MRKQDDQELLLVGGYLPSGAPPSFVFVGLLEFLNHRNSIAGWWLTYPSAKYEFISWDDDIPNIWKKKTFQTTKQLVLKGLMMILSIC